MQVPNGYLHGVCVVFAGRHSDRTSKAQQYLHRHEGAQLLNEAQNLTLLYLIALSEHHPVISPACHLRHHLLC